jgi:hypothetical protein
MYKVTDGGDYNDYFNTLGCALRELDERKGLAWVIAPNGYIVACNKSI